MRHKRERKKQKNNVIIEWIMQKFFKMYFYVIYIIGSKYSFLKMLKYIFVMHV